jgi:hypothetical protein
MERPASHLDHVFIDWIYATTFTFPTLGHLERYWKPTQREYDSSTVRHAFRLDIDDDAAEHSLSGVSPFYLQIIMVSPEQRWERAHANYVRTRANFIAAAGRKINAARNLRLKYHLPNHIHNQILNAILANLVRNERVRVRHRARARVLSSVLIPNIANRIARSPN